MILFTLYSRSYCHLCEDMRNELEKLVQHIPHQIVVIDVDQDPELVKLYDELVPVLFASKTVDNNATVIKQELCHYFLDADKVKAFCDE